MAETENLSKSGLAIAALVVSIVAVLGSVIPIINNLSFFLAIIALGLGIPAMISISHGKHSGKEIGIASIVISIVTIVLVLASQSLYSTILDEAVDDTQTESAAQQSADGTDMSDDADANASEAADAEEDTDFSNLAIGDGVILADDLVVSVDKVETGLANYDGSEVVAVTVTYTNNGSSTESYNTYDWKVEDKKGALRAMTIYINGENELGSGSLSAGGSVTGTIYFDAPVTKVHYYSSLINSESTAAWNVE